MKNKKRMGCLRLHEVVTLAKAGLTVWAYNNRGKYVGRVEINHAALAAYIGSTGKKRLGNMSWEKFFERLTKKKKNP
jgi:hypothetical protein